MTTKVHRKSRDGFEYELNVPRTVWRPRDMVPFAEFDLARDWPDTVAIVNPDDPTTYMIVNVRDKPPDAELWPDQYVVPPKPTDPPRPARATAAKSASFKAAVPQSVSMGAAFEKAP